MVVALYCVDRNAPMQSELPTTTVDPRTEIQECWRVQASENVDSHAVLSAIDELVVEQTVDAMIAELVDFEAVTAL